MSSNFRRDWSSGLPPDDGCRLASRLLTHAWRSRYRSTDENKGGWEAAVGLALKRAIDECRNLFHDCPRNTQLVSAINTVVYNGDDRINEGQFGKFLAGDIRGNTPWYRVGQYGFAYLLGGHQGIEHVQAGKVPENSDNRWLGLVIRHHFGDDLKVDRSTYFGRHSRWWYGAPWDAAELAGEVSWAAYCAEMATKLEKPLPIEVVSVSASDSLPHLEHPIVARALAYATHYGVKARFVVPVGSTLMPKLRELAKSPGWKGENVVVTEANPASPGWFHSTLQFMYFGVPMADIGPFVLQCHGTHNELQPMTVKLAEAHAADFRRWLSGLPEGHGGTGNGTRVAFPNGSGPGELPSQPSAKSYPEPARVKRTKKSTG